MATKTVKYEYIMGRSPHGNHLSVQAGMAGPR